MPVKRKYQKRYPSEFCPDVLIYNNYPDEKFPIHTSEENVKDIVKKILENAIDVASIHASEEKVSEFITDIIKKIILKMQLK